MGSTGGDLSRSALRSPRSRSTLRWRRAPALRTSCTVTRGTRTSPGTSRVCATGSPTSRPSTASSRCDPGRRSSSAAATPSRALPNAPDSRAPTRSSRCPPRCVVTFCAATRRSTPQRVSVIHNGIDTDEYRPDPATDVLERRGIDPQLPTVVFVGRITRQKGLRHLLDAAELVRPGRPARARRRFSRHPRDRRRDGRAHRAPARDAWRGRLARRSGGRVREVIQILSHASVFVCPSVYEPFGIVNLEAMACETPVVATRHRRHPRGRRARPHGAARPVRATRRRLARASRPGRVRPRDSRASRPACSPTPSMRARSAGPDANGPSSSSAGRRSPRARSSCTAAFSDQRQPCRAPRTLLTACGAYDARTAGRPRPARSRNGGADSPHEWSARTVRFREARTWNREAGDTACTFWRPMASSFRRWRRAWTCSATGNWSWRHQACTPPGGCGSSPASARRPRGTARRAAARSRPRRRDSDHGRRSREDPDHDPDLRPEPGPIAHVPRREPAPTCRSDREGSRAAGARGSPAAGSQ